MVLLWAIGKSTVQAPIVALLVLGWHPWRSVDACTPCGLTGGPALVFPCFLGPTLLLLRYRCAAGWRKWRMGTQAQVRLEVAVRHTAAVVAGSERICW